MNGNKAIFEELAEHIKFRKNNISDSESKYGKTKKEFIKSQGKIEGKRLWKILKKYKKGTIEFINKQSKHQNQISNTNDKIKRLEEEAGILYSKIVDSGINAYIFSYDYTEGENNNGYNNLSFEDRDKNNVKLKTSSFRYNKIGAIEVWITNSPSEGVSVLKIIQHELGHGIYHIENTQLYYNWLQKTFPRGIPKDYDGHRADDPSGIRAKKYENIDFKCN